MTRGTDFWSEYIVHIPLPTAFEDAKHHAELLANVRYLLLVGSLMRPRRLAKLAEEKFGLKRLGTYFNIVDHYEICDREYCIEIVDLGLETGETMAIVSHGIGGSGAEIVIKEMRALVHWSNAYLGLDESKVQIRCVGRSGTRGTLGDVPYGTVGVSTASYNDEFDVALPDANLNQLIVDNARKLDIPIALGSGVSTNYFWLGQGRHVPAEGRIAKHIEDEREKRAQDKLWSFVERGIIFAEMEDYTVHSICRALGIASASVGCVIARRYDVEKGEFIIDYDRNAKALAELLPAQAIMTAFVEHAKAAK
jgi:uridine phosphorylase